MDKNRLIPTIWCGIALCFFVSRLFAGDIILEMESGDVVLLHSDHTWDFQSHASDELTKNVSMILDNGQAIKINKNHTWYYIEQKGREETFATDEVEYLGTAYSMGNAHSADLIEAKMMAINQATVELSKQLLSALGDKTLTLKKLNHCIEREDKDIEVKENMKNNMWYVVTRLTVDSYQIQMIIECARGGEEE
jgi:hypothetical protein